MQWKNPNELFGQPNISRRKRTLDPSNNQTGLRTDTLYMLCSLLIWLQSFLPLAYFTADTPDSLQSLQLAKLCPDSGPLRLLFPYLECFSSEERASHSLHSLHRCTPPESPSLPNQIIKAHVCLFYVSIMDTFRFITANFTSLAWCWVDPSKVQNETHLPPQMCFCHGLLHYSTRKMHPTTTWSQPFGALSFLYTQHPISNFVGSAFKNIS